MGTIPAANGDPDTACCSAHFYIWSLKVMNRWHISHNGFAATHEPPRPPVRAHTPVFRGRWWWEIMTYWLDGRH